MPTILSTIRSIFLNDLGETEDEGCYFGWTANSLKGTTPFGLWRHKPYPLQDVSDNLAFCVGREWYDHGG